MSWSEIKKKKEEEEKKKKSSNTSDSTVKQISNVVTGSLWKNIGQNIITSQRNAEARKQREEEFKRKLNINQNIHYSQNNNNIKREIQPSAIQTFSNNSKDTNSKNNTSIWDQIKNIVNNKNAMTLASKNEIANATRLSSADIDAMKEANKFNKIMKNGSAQEKFNAVTEHFGNSIIGGAKQTVGGVANIGTTLASDVVKTAKLIANEKEQEKLDNWYNKIVDKGREINDKATYFNKVNSRLEDKGVRTVTGATNTVANVATNALLTAGTGGGAVLQGLQVGGSSAQEVLNENKDASGKAMATGIAKGITSYLTEKMFDANILTKGAEKSSIQKLVNNTIESKIKSQLGRNIADKATGIIGENLEEIVEDNVGNLIDRVVNNKKLPEWKEWLNNTSETIKATTLSTAILNLVGLGGDNNQDIEADLRKQNASEQDIQKAKEFVQAVTQENIQSQNTDNKDINQEQKTSQNGFSQAEKAETLRQEARDKLESIKQNYDENSYNQMREFIETAPNEKALSQVINDLNKEVETKQVAPIKQKQEVQLPMKQETQNKSFEDVAFEAMSNYESNEVESPLKNRDMSTIGKQTNVNAYQYDNPKVKPYFQEMAQQMGEDLAYISSSDNRSTQKGGGTKLSATTKAMDILHNEQGYSYNQIAQGLQNIIDDKGSENNAISKKIELVIDEQLRNGYNNALGKYVEPNQEYINTITEQYSLAEQPQQNNFKYEQSNNAKVDTFRQDASKYWDNSEKTAKLVNTIEKVINDKGYNIRLNDTIGDNVNGKIVTNQETGEIEITINPNSSRAGEFILGHELTHAIQTQEMVDLVNNRMQKDGDLRNAVEDLKKLYNTDEVNAEVLADISGQLFGNQEFINNLSVEKPNVFKRIYDKIVSLANKITGNSSEALFIKDLRNKWEQAYRENNNTINEEQYSIETENNQEKLENNVKKVYNIINKSITNSERNQVSSEVLTWRNNQDDGVGYIDLSAKGYKSYIYNKQGNNVETLLKVNGNEDFKNYIRKGIEDGTFKNTEGLIKPIDAIKNEYRRYSNNNDLLSRRRTDNSNDKLSVGFNGEQGTDNSTENIKQSSRNESIENSEKGSFNLSENKRFDVTGNENLDKSGTLFFRTREDGIYYVQATDHSGDLIYEGTFLNKKSLSRTLGEDIANYIVENSEKTNNEIYIENNGNTKSETDYMMRHRPSEEYGNGSNFEKNMDGVFEHPQWYMNMNEDWNVESLNALRKIRNKPDAEITIYRATPGNKINPGDWVTPSKKYAELHNNSQLDGKGNILELKVKAKDILWGGDDINEFGYYPNNEKYSKQNNNWQDYLESNYKSEGTTTDLRDIRLPMKEKQEVKLPMKQENTQQTQEQNNNTKGENINWNEIERPEENRKFRKHYKSIIESDNTTAEAKSIAKELMKTDTYVPETNKGQLAQADERIMTSSPEAELQSLRSRVLNGERITSVDIAVGERLIQYFSKTGSAEQLQDAIQTTALAGTSTGQTLQALTILNHQTPQGQVTWIQRSIEKINKELAKKKGGTITKDEDGNLKIVNKQGKDITDKVKLFDLTPEMMNKIMQSENQEQMLKNIDEVYEELGQQVPKDMIEKIDSWRYFSMLANARTHIRNMVGNVAMGKMQRAKDKIAGGIEDVVSKFNPEMERTKTLRRADKKVKEFAKNDFKNIEVQSRLELNESKFKPQSRLQNARRTFKSDVMENTLGRLFDLNDTLLEAEDGLGLKAGYQKALADYLTANKIDVDNITDAQLGKARNYAIQQAKEATFHQANALASWASQIGSNNWQAPKGKMAKFFVDAVLPFKKTPMNVAKSGVEYSPVGLLKSAIFDTAKLRKGDISVNQYIDNISKGLTGTGIALTGYALAKAGILKASGGDDKDKEKYDEEQGKQSYSIEIAGKTYSLDWLAPTGIPLFVGAETYKLFNQTDTEKSTEKSSEEDKFKKAIKSATNLANAGATAINPMSEMSMISGLTSALSSYNTQDNLGSLGNIMTNAGKSYINQFFPTLMGQVAKTGDEYERTTKSTATGTIGKAVDQTINQIKNKVPGLRQTLPIKTDIWGKEVKQEVNLPLRAVNNFINPATVKEVSTDKVDMELNKLYEENRNSALLPDILTKTVQLNKQTYRLSNKEYAEFTKNYGQTSHKLIENFIKTSDYNKLTQEQKETAISNIYSYAKEQNKLDYAKKVNEEIKPSTLYTTMKEIEKGGGKQSEYLNYLAKTKGISKENEKNKVLADSNYSNKTKEIIYANGTGKDDNLYNNLLSKSNINMTEYLKYKNKLSEKAFGADKDKNGKTIAGSAKAKTINYLNNNITGVGNRLLIAGKSYALQNSEKQKLVEYINSSVSTREERLEIYKQLDKNFTIKNGKVYMKVSKK